MQVDIDEFLKEGLIIFVEREFSDVPAGDEIEHEFSEKYLKEKKELIESLDETV